MTLSLQNFPSAKIIQRNDIPLDGRVIKTLVWQYAVENVSSKCFKKYELIYIHIEYSICVRSDQ